MMNRDLPLQTWQQRPESLGYVRAKSSDPFAKPLIQPNYLAHEEDRRVLLAGIKLSRRLMNTEPLAPYFDYEGYPGVHIQNDDELLGCGAPAQHNTLSS